MNNSGEYSGISIFLWDKIADELELNYSIDEFDRKELMESVIEGKADIAVSCISIDHEHEKIIDFSHSFYETNLAIAVKQHGLLQTIKNILTNERLLLVLGIIVGIAAFIGGIFFLLEHRTNEKLYSMKTKGGKLLDGFIAGLLFVTSGPIRYYEFKTLSGRTIAAFLAVGGTVIIASITALMASAFTLDQMHSNISGPQDLAKVRVGVMKPSPAFNYLQEQGINSRTFSDKDELFAALDNGLVDAVVGEAAVLKFNIREAQAEGKYESLSVLPYVFERKNYGFALQDENPLLEELNQALLSVRESPEWRKEMAKYLGKE